MSTTDPDPTTQALNEETRRAWETIAEFWDAYMGEGRGFQNVLIGPTTERLLAIQPDEHVLDIACGNGAFSRRLAALGARVVACDFSARFIELARRRTTEHADRIEYRVVDATDEAQLLALGEGHFDAAVCTMALMDMATIEPLMRAVRRLLTPHGRFVFSTMHPAFNSNGCIKVMERDEREGQVRITYGVKVTRYLQPFAENGIGVVGQPVPHISFHRPLSELLRPCFRAGFVVDALEETAFPGPADPALGPSWSNLTEIPPVLIARLRPS